MKKELQDLAWSVLPKEFKDKVKELYREFASTREGYYKELFGRRNLTSDAEGEEMLYCDKSVVQSMAKSAIHSIQINDYKGNTIASQNMATFNRGIMCALETLFGSKCLPDEKINPERLVNTIKESIEESLPDRMLLDGIAEPKYKRGDIVMYDGTVQTIVSENIRCGREYYLSGVEYPVAESDLEPYVEPSEEESANTQPESVGWFHLADEETHLRNYSRDMANCDKSDNNRLQIAAMAMQGMLSNAEITSFGGMQEATHREYIVEYALHYADALIAKCGKGGLQ